MENKIKILNCIPDSRYGGPHRRNSSIAYLLKKFDMETVFLIGIKEDCRDQIEGFDCFFLKNMQFLKKSCPISNFVLFLLFLPINIYRLSKIIKKNSIKIVHINGVTNIIPALAAKLCSIPVVWHINDSALPIIIRRFCRLIFCSLSNYMIFQSKKLLNCYLGRKNYKYKNFSVIYSSVDTEIFNADNYNIKSRRTIFSEFNIPESNRLIGMVGNINFCKGHTYFLKAASILKENYRSVKFIIIGKKLNTAVKYMHNIESQINELKLQDDVIFTGFRKDVPDFLAAMDVFVLSSIEEACPNVLLEAMSMPIPVVATNVGAVSEIAGVDKSITVVPPYDSNAIANAILDILNMDRLYLQSRLNISRNKIKKDFSVHKAAELQKDIYLKVLDR